MRRWNERTSLVCSALSWRPTSSAHTFGRGQRIDGWVSAIDTGQGLVEADQRHSPQVRSSQWTKEGFGIGACDARRWTQTIVYTAAVQPARDDRVVADALVSSATGATGKVTSMSSGGRYLRVSEGVRGRRRGDCWRLDLGVLSVAGRSSRASEGLRTDRLGRGER